MVPSLFRRGSALCLVIHLSLALPCLGDSTIVFNEIMYHPEGNVAELEWLELHSQMAVDMDISGWSIAGGIDFSFPEGTVVPGKSYLVVAASPEALALKTGLSGILGPFTGRLDNSGDLIELYNNSRRLMDSVEYGDDKAWPTAPDGSGASLAKADPDLASPPAASWRTSAQLGGTPGALNFPSADSPTAYPAGLVSYWSLDQKTGALLDLADGNNGTPGAGATRATGIVGSGAVAFDNTTSAYIAVGIGTGGNFAVSDGIAVEALIRAAWSGAPGDEDTIFRKEDGPLRIVLAFQNDDVATNRDVPLDPPQQPVLSLGLNVGGVYSELDMPLDGAGGRPMLADLKDGQAHHVAGTYDVGTGLKALYYDGKRVFEHGFPPGTPIASGGTTTAYIGNMSGRLRPFTGAIDEVAFWGRALSAAEVSRHVEQFAAGRSYFDESIPESGGPRLAFNEYSASTGELFWIEIVNLGPGAASLGGHLLSVLGNAAVDYVFPAGDLPSGGYAVVGEADLGFRPVFGDTLFLYAPARAAALDGLRIEGTHRARLPQGTGRWRLSPRLTPGETNDFDLHDEIVINEILYHHRPVPDGSGLRESPEAWIELYNRSTSPVDMGGWRLDDAVSFTFQEGTVLGPGEYLVVAADKVSLAALHPTIPIVGNFQGRLSHKEDRIVLEDSWGNPADEVRYYDGGRWPRYADGGGSSLELVDPRADNSRPEAWAASDEASRSEWKTYSYRGTAAQGVGPTRWNEFVLGLLEKGEALLDDLSVVDSPDTAPKELLQNGGFEPGAASWRFLGTHRWSEVIPEPGNPANHVLHLVATGPTEHMHNHIETTFKSGLSVVNGRQYRISFRARWLAGSNQLNTRLYFNRLPRTTLLEVPQVTGTPGERNLSFAANIGATFGDLSHSPVVPEPGEDVEVKVAASDPDGIASVALWWNPSGSGWRSAPMTALDGGIYSGTIPAPAASTLVQFYVEALDGAGASSTLPAAGPDSRALFRVDDGLGKGGKLHTLRILMLPADATFVHQETNVMSNEWLPCTLVYDERAAAYDGGVRLKGSERGRPESGRVGFHLKFPPDRLFRGVHPTVHIDRSGGWYFGGPSGQDEILVKHIVNHAGDIPGMYDDIVRTIAPQAAQNGPALLMMAAFNDHYLDSQYENGSDGTEYKLELIYYPTTTVDGNPESLKRPLPDEVIGTDLTNLGDDKEAYRWTFLIENNEDLDDFTRLIGLCKAFGASAAQLDAATRAVMDVDQWMRCFTIISLCGVTDTYTQGNNHNNIFYVRPSDQKMLAFPWDMDFAWVRSWSSYPLWGDQNLSRIIQLPQNTRLFYGHLLDITTTTFNTAYLTRWATHYGQLAEEDYSALLTYIGQRQSFVLSKIPGKVPFAITTNGGADFTVDQFSTTLEGNAWFDVRQIYVANRPDPLEPTWTTTIDGIPTKWRAEVDLDFGANRLQLLALDRYLDLVGTATITVTSTVGGPAPGISSVEPSHAAAGDTIAVQGTNFRDGIEVFFGAVKSGSVVIESPTTLRVLVPVVLPGVLSLYLRNADGRTSYPVDFLVRDTSMFIRADANGDGRVDLGDAVRVLFHLFEGDPLPCEDAADADDSEAIDLTDIFRILSYLFLDGPSPRMPFPVPGLDPGGTALGCEDV